MVPSIVSPTAAMVTEAGAGPVAAAGLASAAGQAASTSTAADPTIAHQARTEFRIGVNVTRHSCAGGRLARALRLCDWAGR